MVTLPVTEVPWPRFDVIDAHNHLGRWLAPAGTWMVRDVDALCRVMDERRLTHLVNLDGRWDAELEENLDRYDRAHPDRFSTFCHLDWSLLAEPHATRRLIESLEASAAAGAKGLKVWKDLGLHVRDRDLRLVLPDDERLVPVWQAAGDLNLPICIHTADPVAFFAPLDERNERLDELGRVPAWWFGDRDRFPSFEQLIEALERAVASAPATRFMGAHVGGYAENLAWVRRMFEQYPNFWVDIGGRLGEIGRQPRAFRRLALDFPDRILFGTDCFPVESADYALHYRFLETDDEYFPYWIGDRIAPQGRWHISGVHLPSEVLEPIYHRNADTLLHGDQSRP
jgi:predicted TIM-barrel fold metal-dependent hydrolase